MENLDRNSFLQHRGKADESDPKKTDEPTPDDPHDSDKEEVRFFDKVIMIYVFASPANDRMQDDKEEEEKENSGSQDEEPAGGDATKSPSKEDLEDEDEEEEEEPVEGKTYET